MSTGSPARPVRHPGGSLETPLVLVAAASSMALFAVWYILWLYLPSFNTTHTALEGVPHPPSALRPTPGVARRLVIVLLDGVSFDVARSLEELLPLRRVGVMRPLVVEFPSYTDPAITSLVTGLDPEDSGMRLNGRVTGVPGLDTVTAAALEAGVPVRVRSRGWEELADLLRGREADVSNSQVRFQAELTAATVRGWPALEPVALGSPSREIAFAYIVEADKAGHYHGGRSPEFAEASHHGASMVARYARTLDLEQDALVVVSDHGHVAGGGHGGVEPEILRSFFLAAGPLVRQGVELHERPLRDVASTLSVLSGLRAPSSSLGRPMLDALTLDDGQRSYLLAAPFDQAARLLCAISPSARCAEIEPLVERLRKADGAAASQAEALFDALTYERRSGVASRSRAGARARLGIAAGLLAIGAVLLAIRRRAAAREASKLLILPAAHALIFGVGLWLQGYTPSFSSVKTQLGFYGDAAIASAFAIALTLALSRASRASALAPWTALLGTAIPIALLAAWVGLDPRTLPPPTESILLLQVAPMVLSAGVLSTLLATFRRRDPKSMI